MSIFDSDPQADQSWRDEPVPYERQATTKEAFLEHVRLMVGYWDSELGSNVPPETSKRDALEGLAFSICVALDGGAAVGPYMVAPLDDAGEVCGPDIAGSLHEELWSAPREETS